MVRSSLPDTWSVSKCKRIVRPLVSKVHSLNELYTNYPSIIEFDISQFQSVTDDKDIIQLKTSIQRLNSLKPFISPELYKYFQEILQIFKTIVTTPLIVKNRDSSPSKLSDLCSYKVGQSIAVYSKTSHYKLNNSILFDKEELEVDASVTVSGSVSVSVSAEDLVDDIDYWLEMEPTQIISSQRQLLLLGYTLHFLIFHLNTLLYPLIPVIIHWLYEQQTPQLVSLGRNLFQEFWYNNADSNGELTKQAVRFNDIFWVYLKKGYWESFITQLNLKSSSLTNTSYQALIIDTLPLNDKLSDISSDISSSIIFPIMLHVPQHYQINSILIYSLSNQIHKFRLDIHKCAEPKVAETLLITAIHDIELFLSIWLGFSNDMYNSLLPGNEELFMALERFTGYCKSTIFKLEPYIEVDQLSLEFTNITNTIALLKSYFLFTSPPTLSGWEISKISNVIVKIQKSNPMRKTNGQRDRNSEFEDFVIWLRDIEPGMASLLIKKYYKGLPIFKYKRIHRELFEEVIETMVDYEAAVDDSEDDIDMDTSFEGMD